MTDAAQEGVPAGVRSGKLNVAIVGATLRSASILRLLNEVENIAVVAVADPNRTAPAIRLAEDLGVFTTPDITELYQVTGLDLTVDPTEDAQAGRRPLPHKPAHAEPNGAPATATGELGGRTSAADAAAGTAPLDSTASATPSTDSAAATTPPRTADTTAMPASSTTATSTPPAAPTSETPGQTPWSWHTRGWTGGVCVCAGGVAPL